MRNRSNFTALGTGLDEGLQAFRAAASVPTEQALRAVARAPRRPLTVEMLPDLGDHDRPFPHGRGNPLDRPGANVAHRENPRA